jgi:aromatic-L-amino-acid decarboxylase
MTPEEFRRYGHALIDWIADYRARVAAGGFPVTPRARPPAVGPAMPGELRSRLPAEAPLHPDDFADVLADLERLVLPSCTHWQDPRFFGYFPSNGLPAAVLGDLASTGLGQLGLNWQSSPALTELEEVATDWLRRMLGLSGAWRGVIHDTASSATLVALVCARERTTRFETARAGLGGAAAPLVVYTSAQSHSSVEKAALIAGFGRDNLRLLEVDRDFALRPDALDAAIRADLAAGRRPCAIVATTGTTATTALDPIADCARLAREHGLWLHVDAALAGSAMILPECRWMWDGIEGADSLVLNPHKWLGVSFDCSTYFVRDAQHLVRTMSSNPSYLRTGADAEATNYRDWGIPLGRRMRALKLWFTLREQGVAGLQARLRRDLDNARWLAACVDDPAAAARGWRRVAPVPLQTVCVRHEPAAVRAGPARDDGTNPQAFDAHTLAWVGRINASGCAWLTPSQLDGRWMVRVSIGAAATERRHVEQLWALMQREAEGEGCS